MKLNLDKVSDSKNACDLFTSDKDKEDEEYEEMYENYADQGACFSTGY